MCYLMAGHRSNDTMGLGACLIRKFMEYQGRRRFRGSLMDNQVDSGYEACEPLLGSKAQTKEKSSFLMDFCRRCWQVEMTQITLF